MYYNRKYISKKYSTKRYKRKLFLNKLESISINLLAVFLILISCTFILNTFILHKNKVSFSVSDVEAFNIPHNAMLNLIKLSNNHKLNFPEVLTFYSLESNFYLNKNFNNTVEYLEESFFKKYKRIKNKYSNRKVKPYYELISNILYEIKYFPIPKEYVDSHINSYTYINTYGAVREDSKLGKQEGVDLLNVTNKSGVIPIVSMTNGVVDIITFDDIYGYTIGIKTDNDNIYYYSHLDRFEEHLIKGTKIKAGRLLGYMGNTGKKDGNGRYQVRLHLSLLVNTDIRKDDFWLNLYPFLKILEYNKVRSLL